MQKNLNGTQLRMKRYRGMPLKQALGDINGAKRAKDTEKRMRKAIRTHLKRAGKLTPERLAKEMKIARAKERA